MRKKDILVKSKYNRISVAFVKEGKTDKKAELRIWVTKGRCSPVFDEIMTFDLNSDDPDEFISKANAIIKDLKARYFDHYDDEEKRKEKRRKYRAQWLSRGNNKEDVKKYHRQRRTIEEVISKHRVDNARYYSKVKATYSGRKDWEPDEDNYIKNNPNKSLAEIATHLGRSISSVSQRRHKIKHGILYMK